MYPPYFFRQHFKLLIKTAGAIILQRGTNIFKIFKSLFA